MQRNEALENNKQIYAKHETDINTQFANQAITTVPTYTHPYDYLALGALCFSQQKYPLAKTAFINMFNLIEFAHLPLPETSLTNSILKIINDIDVVSPISEAEKTSLTQEIYTLIQDIKNNSNKDISGAIETITQAIKKCPEEYAYYFSRATVEHEKLNDFDNAEKDLSVAIFLTYEQNNFDFMREYIGLRENVRNLRNSNLRRRELIANLESELVNAPNNINLLKQLANLYFQLKETDKGKDCLTKIKAIPPETNKTCEAQVFFTQAQDLRRKNTDDKGRKSYLEAFAKADDDLFALIVKENKDEILKVILPEINLQKKKRQRDIDCENNEYNTIKANTIIQLNKINKNTHALNNKDINSFINEQERLIKLLNKAIQIKPFATEIHFLKARFCIENIEYLNTQLSTLTSLFDDDHPTINLTSFEVRKRINYLYNLAYTCVCVTIWLAYVNNDETAKNASRTLQNKIITSNNLYIKNNADDFKSIVTEIQITDAKKAESQSKQNNSEKDIYSVYGDLCIKVKNLILAENPTPANFNQAKELSTNAIKLCDKFWDAYYLLGQCYEKTNDLDNALTNYLQVITLLPINFPILARINRIYARKHATTEEQIYKEKYIEAKTKFKEFKQYYLQTLKKYLPNHPDVNKPYFQKILALDTISDNHQIAQYASKAFFGKYFIEKQDFFTATFYFKQNAEFKADFYSAYHLLVCDKEQEKVDPQILIDLATLLIDKYEYPPAYVLRGEIFYQVNDFDMAEGDLLMGLQNIDNDDIASLGISNETRTTITTILNKKIAADTPGKKIKKSFAKNLVETLVQYNNEKRFQEAYELCFLILKTELNPQHLMTTANIVFMLHRFGYAKLYSACAILLTDDLDLKNEFKKQRKKIVDHFNSLDKNHLYFMDMQHDFIYWMEDELKKYQTKFPDNFSEHYFLANARSLQSSDFDIYTAYYLFQCGNFIDALYIFNYVFEKDNKNFIVQLLRGLAHFELGNIDAAEADFKAIIENYNYPFAYWGLAACQQKIAGDIEKIKENYSYALSNSVVNEFQLFGITPEIIQLVSSQESEKLKISLAIWQSQDDTNITALYLDRIFINIKTNNANAALIDYSIFTIRMINANEAGSLKAIEEKIVNALCLQGEELRKQQQFILARELYIAASYLNNSVEIQAQIKVINDCIKQEKRRNENKPIKAPQIRVKLIKPPRPSIKDLIEADKIVEIDEKQIFLTESTVLSIASTVSGGSCSSDLSSSVETETAEDSNSETDTVNIETTRTKEITETSEIPNTTKKLETAETVEKTESTAISEAPKTPEPKKENLPIQENPASSETEINSVKQDDEPTYLHKELVPTLLQILDIPKITLSFSEFEHNLINAIHKENGRIFFTGRAVFDVVMYGFIQKLKIFNFRQNKQYKQYKLYLEHPSLKRTDTEILANIEHEIATDLPIDILTNLLLSLGFHTKNSIDPDVNVFTYKNQQYNFISLHSPNFFNHFYADSNGNIFDYLNTQKSFQDLVLCRFQTIENSQSVFEKHPHTLLIALKENIFRKLNLEITWVHPNNVAKFKEHIKSTPNIVDLHKINGALENLFAQGKIVVAYQALQEYNLDYALFSDVIANKLRQNAEKILLRLNVMSIIPFPNLYSIYMALIVVIALQSVNKKNIHLTLDEITPFSTQRGKVIFESNHPDLGLLSYCNTIVTKSKLMSAALNLMEPVNFINLVLGEIQFWNLQHQKEQPIPPATMNYYTNNPVPLPMFFQPKFIQTQPSVDPNSTPANVYGYYPC